MPPYRISPIDNFLNRFIQGAQLYQSFQDMANRQKQTGIAQQQAELARQKWDEEQRRQAELEKFAQSYEAPTQKTVTTPPFIPEQTAPGPLGFTGLSPEVNLPAQQFQQEVPPSEENKIKAQIVRAGYGPGITRMLESMPGFQPRTVNDPTVGPYLVSPGGQPHFPPSRRSDITPDLALKVTPESLRAYRQSGDPTVLEPRDKAAAETEADKERDILAQEVLGADGRPLYKSFAELQEKNAKAAAILERKRKAASALTVRETPPAERRLNRIDAPFIVDKNGNNVPLNKIIGKQLSEVPEAVAVLSATELPGLKAAQRVVRIGDELKSLAPQILKKYGGVSLGQMFKVVGNKIYLTEIAQRAGDPNVVKFQTLLNGFLISEPQALGIPGGRESVRLLELVAKGAPTFGSTIEGLNAAIDTTINTDIAPAWEARGINIQGGSRKSSGNLPPGYEVVK